MATLFLGRRHGASGFAKHVAIKLVHPHLVGDDTFTKMFVDEALLSSRIHHPNVVHVEELGEVGGTHFLVMEYVHGGSLGQLLKCLAIAKRRMIPDLATSIAISAADGLHAAHETTGKDGQPLGVVHRDVTPENILIAFKGHVKVIDFGVAKARDRATQTVAGTLKGKFAYMAPEQAMGTNVDRRTDVYALGIVLWEMLTMRRCFKAPNDLLLLEMVRNPQIPAPHQVVPDIDRKLSAAVMKALSPNPDDRPATAQAFRRLLADAAPRALAMDSSHLADLLGTVMQEEIEKEQEALPAEISSVVVPKVSDPNAIHSLTVGLSAVSPTGPTQRPPTSQPGRPPVPRLRQSGPQPMPQPMPQASLQSRTVDITIDEDAATQALSREEAMAAIAAAAPTPAPGQSGPHGTLPLNPPSGQFGMQPVPQMSPPSGQQHLHSSGQFPTTSSTGGFTPPATQGGGKGKMIALVIGAMLVLGVIGVGVGVALFGNEEPTATALPPAVDTGEAEAAAAQAQAEAAEALQHAAEETARQEREAAEQAAQAAQAAAQVEEAPEADTTRRRARSAGTAEAPEDEVDEEAVAAAAAERLRELTAMDQPVELEVTEMTTEEPQASRMASAMDTAMDTAMELTEAEQEARAERRRRRRERRAQMNMGTIIVTDPGF